MAQRRRQLLTRQVKNARLYLDDLLEIEQIIASTDTDDERSSLTVTGPNWVGATVAEVVEAETSKGPIKRFSIERLQPHVTFTVDRDDGAEATAYDSSNLTAMGVQAAVIERLQKTQRSAVLRCLVSPVTGAVAIAAAVVAALLAQADANRSVAHSFAPRGFDGLDDVLLCIGGGLLLGVAAATYYRWTRSALVYFTTRDQRSAFWTRNRDAVVVGVFLVVLTAVVTTLINRLV